MALSIGDVGATTGMAAAIYDQIRANLEPGMDDLAPEDLEAVRASWRKLAHAIATGVVEHLLSNLEIRDVRTRGDLDVAVSGSTATASGHQHGAGTLAAAQSGVTFDQVSGTGSVA